VKIKKNLLKKETSPMHKEIVASIAKTSIALLFL